jgi:hypothetical protein
MKNSLTTSRPWALATALLTATATTCQGVTPPSLRASGGALSSPSNSNSNNEKAAAMSYRRSLQDKAASSISLLESGEGVHTVILAQTFFGTPSEDEAVCGSKEKDDTAWIMFATWLDPDTLEEVCGMWGRDVTACFQETVAIGCDPNTNTATINVYVRDEIFDPPRDFRVDNPKLGQCNVGKNDFGYKAIHVQETFACLVGGLSGEGGPSGVRETTGTCGADYNECLDGTYCNQSKDGYVCKSYVPAGTSCGGETRDGEQNVCDPARTFCLDSKSVCMLPDAPGKCTPFASDATCIKDDECKQGDYCDESVRRCKERLAEGFCCNAKADQCAPGLDCAKGSDSIGDVSYGSQFSMCRNLEGTCNGDTYDKCGENQYCNFNKMIGWECKAYVAPGSTCGGYTIPGGDNRCNPRETFCAYPQLCSSMPMGGPGKCVAYGANECVSSDNCDPGEWCDTNIGKCKLALAKDECCSANIDSCADGLTCAGQYFELMGLQDTCRTVCDADTDCANGEWCADSDGSLERFCKPYAGTNTDCEFYTIAAFYEKCNPDTHFCMDTMYCEMQDGGGKCTEMGNVCRTSDSECADPTAEWCDTKVGKCKPKYDQGACCDASFKTMCEDGTECETEPVPKNSQMIFLMNENEAPTKCRLPETPLQPPRSVDFCSKEKPRFCGGFAGIQCACTCEDTTVKGPICVDDSSDRCDPKTGGAGCAGICTCPRN